MGVLQTVFRASSPTPIDGLKAVGDEISSIFTFGEGVTLANGKTSLKLSAFYNGVNIISDDIAMLPKSVFKKDGASREKYTDHPVHMLISQKPSGLMNSFELWKIIRISVILKGNAFVEIIRNRSTGRADALVFRNAADVIILEDEENYKLHYKYKGRFISGDDMLHFKGFTLDGKKGVGVVTYAAAQLGVFLDSQTAGSEIYKNKGLTYGVIETEKAVSADAKKALSEGFSNALSKKSPFRAAFLDEGFSYKSIALTPAEAQFLETNQQAVTEVARWLNVAPHKLKDLSASSYSNIYQQSIEHVQYTLLPWITRDEQELNNKLFTDAEAGTVYVKFNVAFLLRGDLDMKQKFYTSMVYSGIYTRNEVRALEDMNPIEGLDEPLQPVNMEALSQVMKNLNSTENAGN